MAESRPPNLGDTSGFEPSSSIIFIVKLIMRLENLLTEAT